MVMAWHIVVFVDEDRVEVLPKCWLINKDICYWPNAKKSAVGSLIKNCSAPDKEKWNIAKIRILAGSRVYDDYAQASNAATKACYSSDFTSSECEAPVLNSSKGRILRQNRRYLSSDEDSEKESSSDSLKSIPKPEYQLEKLTQEESSKDGFSKKKNIYQLEKSTQEESNKDGFSNKKNIYQLEKSTQEESNEERSSNKKKPGEVCSKCTIHEETLEQLCRRISYLSVLIKGMNEDISYIKIKLEASDVPMSETRVEDQEFQFPFLTVAQLEEFDKTLEEKGNYLKMVNFMSHIGGNSPYDFIKRVMGRILADELAAQYSFTGHKGKRRFGDYFITKALREASKNVRSLTHVTESEIEKKFKDWLRHAPARVNKNKGQVNPEATDENN